MRVVVALGGNALQRRGEPMTVQSQRANVRTACEALAPLALEHELVISHGNGPQVGLLALQSAAYGDVEAYPFDVLGAQTEGMIGYFIEQELGNLLPFEKPLATVLTMTEVDPADPAFADPSKFVGPAYGETEARRAGGRARLGGQAGRRPVAPGRAVPAAAAHLRDPSGALAPRAGLGGGLHRRWRHPDDVRSPARAAGRGGGGDRQGPLQRRPGQGCRRGPARHRHRRPRRVTGWGTPDQRLIRSRPSRRARGARVPSGLDGSQG